VELEIKKGKYKHYKGNFYEVLFIAKHTETEEQLVIYKSLDANKIWARPISMWNEVVEIDGKKVKRFELI